MASSARSLPAQQWEPMRNDGAGPASAAAGIDGSPILSGPGKIYMYWMAHYRILVIKLFFPGARAGKRNKFRTRVRRPRGLSRRYTRRHLGHRINHAS